MNKHNKIIDSCGFSQKMREYLKSQNLNEFTLTQIVAGAPITLNQKLELYALLENEDAKTLYYETEQALSGLTLKSGEIFSFEECWYDYEIIEEKKAFSSLFTSLSAALDFLREEIKEENWDETSECWTELKKWVPDNDGTMDYTYTYYLIRDEIVYFESKKYPPHHQYQGYLNSMDLDLPIPFKVGDIVTLNSLPFAPLRQAVLIEVDNSDCCGVQVLYKHDDGCWHTGALKHGAGWHRNRPLLSSLYRLQKTQPVDSDEGEILKRITCCFTGHRPEFLSSTEQQVCEWLEVQVREAVSNGYINFISGMQRGLDIYAAETVIKLKKEGLPIKLICACAWNGMEAQWEQSWIERYHTITELADEVHYVSNIPGRKAFFARDCWMVDRSSLLLAVYNGKNGGTKHTTDYADQKGLEVRMMKDG